MDTVENIIIQVIKNENAESVLEISGFNAQYGTLIKNTQKKYLSDIGSSLIDRIDLTDGETFSPDEAKDIYNNIYESNSLTDISGLICYDIIIIFHLFENMERNAAKEILESMRGKVNKQVLVITPEYAYDLNSQDENAKSGVRDYHPVFFLGMDFSYKMLQTDQGAMQAYSFFPKVDYEPLPCDELPDKHEMPGKLKIAYVIAHHQLTGAMKALFAQMKAMADAGHQISAYYKSDTAEKAVPDWCCLTDNEVFRQVILPEDAKYSDYMHDDEDVVIISWLMMAFEFKDSEIPVALWEQGTPGFFGSHKDLLSSGSATRTGLHMTYRLPVHLLAVSQTVQEALKGIYNRRAQLFTNIIDTGFYYPDLRKNNEIPIILLVGYPWLEFKGFGLAFGALEAAYSSGKFKVQLVVTADKGGFPDLSFPFEMIVNPPQEKLAEIYRNADILLAPSLFESFALPPLEAMASGVAVVATDSGGINTYAEHGVNCFLCEQGDIRSVINALERLLKDKDVRKKLIAAGRETALKFSPEQSVPKYEECLYKILCYENKKRDYK